MKITNNPTKYHNFKLEYDFEYEILEYCRWIKEQLGWKQFTFYDKAWRFSNPNVIEFIMAKYPKVEMDSYSKNALKTYQIEKEQKELIQENALELKKKTTSELVIKNIKGKLYDFQKIAIEFLINNNNKGLISLEMGLGKSLVSLAFIVYQQYKKVFVVCPASVKWSWESETKKWTNLKPFVINSKDGFTMEDYNNHNIFIINYDILKKFYDTISSFHLDCLVLDESTAVKNPKAKRTKLTKMISKKINSIILLSGTPVLAKPVELFSQLNIIDPLEWGDYWSYVKRFCAPWSAPWGMDVSGASNLDELNLKIQRYIFRKRKEEVLDELPDKNFIDFPIELTAEYAKMYKVLENSFIDYLEMKGKTEKEINKSLQAEALVKLNELRQLTSKGKLESAKNIIDMFLENNSKLVVFSTYREPLKKLKEELGDKAVIIIGETKSEDRKEAIERFQNDDKVKIFLGGMLSANTGITLTEAASVLFIDYDWTPANMYQAFSRVDRIGQKAKKINIIQIIAKNTIDDRMRELLAAKQSVVDVLIEGKEMVKSESAIKNLIKSYKK